MEESNEAFESDEHGGKGSQLTQGIRSIGESSIQRVNITNTKEKLNFHPREIMESGVDNLDN